MKTKLLLAILASFLLTAFPAVAQMITGQIVPSRELTKASQVEALAQEKGKAELANPAVHPSGIKSLPKITFTFRAEITRKGVIIHEMWPVSTVAEMEACIIARDLKATIDTTEVKTIPKAQATGEVKPPRAQIVFDDEPVTSVTATEVTQPIEERASYPEITNLPKPEVKNLPAKLEVNLIEMVDAFEKEDTQPAPTPVPAPVAKPAEQPAAPAVISINSVPTPVVAEVDSKTYTVDPLYTYGQDNKLEALEKRLPPFDYSIASAKPVEGDMWAFFANRQNWIHGIAKTVPATQSALYIGDSQMISNFRTFALCLGIAMLIAFGVVGGYTAYCDWRAKIHPTVVAPQKGLLSPLSSKNITRFTPEEGRQLLHGEVVPIAHPVVSIVDGHIKVDRFPVIKRDDTSRIPRHTETLTEESEDTADTSVRGKFPISKTGVPNFQLRKSHHHKIISVY